MIRNLLSANVLLGRRNILHEPPSSQKWVVPSKSFDIVSISVRRLIPHGEELYKRPAILSQEELFPFLLCYVPRESRGGKGWGGVRQLCYRQLQTR